MVHFIMITSAAKRLKNGSGRLPVPQIGSRGEGEPSRRGCGINALFTGDLNLACRSSLPFAWVAVAAPVSKHVRFLSLHALPRGRRCHHSGRKWIGTVSRAGCVCVRAPEL